MISYRRLFSYRVWLMLFIGFSSGLPFSITSSTIQAWFTTLGMSTKEIGLYSLVGIPYAFKFLWSPLMDHFNLPFLGRRRDWMLLTQISLLIAILILSFMHPLSAPVLIALIALVITFTSASQDIAIDAYRTDILKENERGPGSGMFLGGYRAGTMISGGLALIIAEYTDWHTTFCLLAFLMLVGILATLLAPKTHFENYSPRTLSEAIIDPFKQFLTRKSALILLLLILLYKLGDAFALTLMSTFLIRGVGFSLATVGSVVKIYSVAAAIFGAFLGGFLLPRFTLFRALFLFGLLQALSNLLFISLIYSGKSYALLVTAITFEHITSGMATAAFMAFLMSLCDHHFTATQYALFSALSAFGRSFLGPLAGWIAQDYGWTIYYLSSFVIALPGLLLLIYLRKVVQQPR